MKSVFVIIKKNISLTLQMQLSKTAKILLLCYCICRICINFWAFSKKKEKQKKNILLQFFWNYYLWKAWLLKCQNDPVSEYHSVLNVFIVVLQILTDYNFYQNKIINFVFCKIMHFPSSRKFSANKTFPQTKILL